MPQCDKYPSLAWHVVPADDKENARLIVSRIVFDTLEENERKAQPRIAIDPRAAREVG
jgi:hypothetical protein